MVVRTNEYQTRVQQQIPPFFLSLSPPPILSSSSSLSSPLLPLSLSLWIGTSVMDRSMCGHLLKAGYTLTVFNPTLSKAQPLIHLGAHLADSSRVVASQSAVVFSIVGYPSDVRSVVLDPTTGTLSGLCPGCVLVDMTTKNCSSIDAPVIGGGDLNIPIYPGPLFQLPPNLSQSCLWSK